jgi:hypothetical protein
MLLLNWPGSAAAVLTTETSSHQYDKRKITNVVSQFGGVCMLVGGAASLVGNSRWTGRFYLPSDPGDQC